MELFLNSPCQNYNKVLYKLFCLLQHQVNKFLDFKNDSKIKFQNLIPFANNFSDLYSSLCRYEATKNFFPKFSYCLKNLAMRLKSLFLENEEEYRKLNAYRYFLPINFRFNNRFYLKRTILCESKTEFNSLIEQDENTQKNLLKSSTFHIESSLHKKLDSLEKKNAYKDLTINHYLVPVLFNQRKKKFPIISISSNETKNNKNKTNLLSSSNLVPKEEFIQTNHYFQKIKQIHIKNKLYKSFNQTKRTKLNYHSDICSAKRREKSHLQRLKNEYTD